MGWSLLLVVPGVWLRGYAAGYVRKNAELTTTGPYAYTRNPLYLGSMLIAFGFAGGGGKLGGSWWLLAVLFAAIYVPTIQGEEEYLRGHFAGFEEYAAKVPRLLPRLTLRRSLRRERGRSRGSGTCITASTMLYGGRGDLPGAGLKIAWSVRRLMGVLGGRGDRWWDGEALRPVGTRRQQGRTSPESDPG